MGIEAAQYIAQLIATNPLDSDSRSTAAAHLNLLKQVLLNSFSAVGAAVTPVPADLNSLGGLGAQPGNVFHLPSGTVTFFVQATAPTGWTQVTTWNDAVLRLTAGNTGGSTGGSWTIAGITTSDAGHAITIDEMPAHTHTFLEILSAQGAISGSIPSSIAGTSQSGVVGSGLVHTHTVTFLADGTWRPAYVNVIACSKN